MKPAKKSKKTPRRMRGEHPSVRIGRYKGDLLSEKISDVEGRLWNFQEDLHAATPEQRKKLMKKSKQRQRARAIKKLNKRLAQYRSEYNSSKS